MKVCAYCGRENDETLTQCRECGTAFPVDESSLIPQPQPEESPPEIRGILDLEDFPDAFSFEDGFSRPNWEIIDGAIQAVADPESLDLAWDDAVLQWTEKVAKELGGGYRLAVAGRCVLLSNLEKEVSQRLLRFTQSVVFKIQEYLPGIAWKNFVGLQVVFLFSEGDDYYQYISAFYPDGAHTLSVGVHLYKDYSHVACLYQSEASSAQVIMHELVHHSMHHLPIPLWLHEALAMTIERTINSSLSHMLADDLPERHLRFWDEKSIQRFWAGTSFHEPGDPQELSYSLSEVLLHLLARERSDFLAFIQTAHHDDAGQTAALDCLGTCLGEAAGTFLGPGNWRPQRKAIKECWEAARPKN